ncbi:hypothetical protein V6294_06330 [Serratia marcescens]|uniref:hypothetical protein n=1 Tax=Serratia marcescens TaxID=615 RepID=UPI003B864656|nr:hypothetical protein SME04J_22740 [Serratia marcescens]
MPSAHCICPDFLSRNISDPMIFQQVFLGSFLTTDDQIILDAEGRLLLEYMESVREEQNAFGFFKTWRALLENRTDGKILLTPGTTQQNVKSLIIDIVSRAVTTFNKSIVVHDNNNYSPFISELNRQRISLLNLQNISGQNIINALRKKVTYDELDYDLRWILHRLTRLSNRGRTEDDYNDYIRDMMLSKKYEVRDQTREGISSSGLSAGELDLAIEDNGELFSIIEPMKLTSVDSNYINLHYTKLLRNYNPLMVKRTFLITYYEGSRFEDWWVRYQEHIHTLDNNSLNIEPETVFGNIEIHGTDFPTIKKLIHHFSCGNEHFACIHYAVKLSR